MAAFRAKLPAFWHTSRRNTDFPLCYLEELAIYPTQSALLCAGWASAIVSSGFKPPFVVTEALRLEVLLHWL